MIKISIKNVKHHTNVALLVDKPQFIKAVKELREKWNITKLFKPDQYQDFYSHIWGKNTDESRWDEFLHDIQKVRRHFNRTSNFDKVIIYAVGFTEIPDKAYRSTYCKVIENPANPDDIEYAIIVTPYTTTTEVRAEFNEFKKMIKAGLEQETDRTKLNSAVKTYEYEPGPKFPDSKGHPTIEQLRQWYWVMFEEVIKCKTKKPRNYEQTLTIWQERYCPVKGNHSTDEETDSCPVCSVNDASLLRHSLADYIEKIKQS